MNSHNWLAPPQQKPYNESQIGNAPRSLRSGNTTKARLRPVDFEALPIALPDTKDQRRLVAAYQKALDKAAKLDAQAHKIERDAQREFEAALGLTPPPSLPKRPFQIARFRDIDRWSHEGILHRALSASKHASEGFPEAPLGELIEDIENGWSIQCATRPACDDAWAILKISAVSSGMFRPDQNKALPPKFKPRPGLEVHPGDLLITRCNIAHLVGVSTLVRTTPSRFAAWPGNMHDDPATQPCTSRAREAAHRRFALQVECSTTACTLNWRARLSRAAGAILP